MDKGEATATQVATTIASQTSSGLFCLLNMKTVLICLNCRFVDFLNCFAVNINLIRNKVFNIEVKLSKKDRSISTYW